MQFIPILEPPTKEALEMFARKRNLGVHSVENYKHPQEDYLMASDSPPVFAVADGVTLDFKKLDRDGKKYPNPSPAGEVAKIFCEAVVKSVHNKYYIFDANKVAEVFKEANSEVEKYNLKIGKSDVSGNITGFYAATGALAVIKDQKAYWASICDSFVARFDKEMNLKFMSSGVCIPYAVTNGEKKMTGYLEKGVFDLETGDRIFVFTDGFEHYVKNPDFIKLFKNWDDGLRERIAEFSKKVNQEDPEKYGHERSLAVIVI